MLKSVHLLLKTKINYEARIDVGHKHAWGETRSTKF
jgi:hypothetical protein